MRKFFTIFLFALSALSVAASIPRSSVDSRTVVTGFGYAHDGQRLWKWKNRARDLDGKPDQLQVWIGDIYEEKGGKGIFHVFAGEQRVCSFESGSALAVDGGGGYTTHVGYYYHQDHLGSSSVLTDSVGQDREVNDWYPFGRVRWAHPQAPFDVSNQFTGQVKDEETGLYYYNSRYYDPELGRFIQPDTIIPDLSNPQSYNRYSYVLNNPLKYVDPTGHVAETGWDAMNIAFGMSSLGANLSRGNLDAAFLDAGGLLIDSAAAATPFVPGFAGSTIRAKRAAQALPAAEALQLQRFIDKAVDAGKIDQSKVSKIPGVAAKGGRLGNQVTRDHIADVAKELEFRGWEIKGGGDRLPEEYLSGPGGARKGSSYPDITATKGGRTLRVNTVDTRSDGLTPTTREARNAAKIRSQTPGDRLLLIPKPR